MFSVRESARDFLIFFFACLPARLPSHQENEIKSETWRAGALTFRRSFLEFIGSRWRHFSCLLLLCDEFFRSLATIWGLVHATQLRYAIDKLINHHYLFVCFQGQRAVGGDYRRWRNGMEPTAECSVGATHFQDLRTQVEAQSSAQQP